MGLGKLCKNYNSCGLFSTYWSLPSFALSCKVLAYRRLGLSIPRVKRFVTRDPNLLISIILLLRNSSIFLML
jgi:hypothetical protein